MGLADLVMDGLGVRFAVRIEPGNYDLGSWATADGLEVAWDVAGYRAEEGAKKRFADGRTSYRATYSTVKLARAVCAETKAVKAWLAKASLAHELFLLTIELYGHEDSGSPIMTWELKDAVPVKWSVGGFEAAGTKLAIETLEIDHAGFLDSEPRGA